MATTIPVHIRISGMHCASCVARVERGLSRIDGLSNIAVNLTTETGHFDAETPDHLAQAVARLGKLGFPALTETVDLAISGMSCASCVARIDRAVAKIPGVQTVSVNLATERATVTYLADMVNVSALTNKIAQLGFSADPIMSDDRASAHQTQNDKSHSLRAKFYWALVLTLPVFILEMGGHLIPALHHWVQMTLGTQSSWMIQLILTSLVLIGPGRDFYTKGLNALRRGGPDMNSLVAVGTLAAYGYSLVVMIWPNVVPDQARAVYFESAAVIVTLVLAGRYLEARAKGKTGAAIRSLLDLQPASAQVERDGRIIECRAAEIALNDTLLVRPGERIATDGLVIDGHSHVDESMLTGEAIAVDKQAGSTVTGGTVNLNGLLRVAVTQIGDDTRLAQIIRMVERAQNTKLPIQNLVDRVTLWFVPVVMGLSVLTVMLWLVLAPALDISFALVAGVSVLIIACPCAMGLATPTSIMVGMGRAAGLGILFRKGQALQELSQVSVVALDKTGTVTLGQPELTEFQTAPTHDPNDVLSAIAGIEAGSQHPVATAILRYAKAQGADPAAATDFQNTTGRGVRAQVSGHRYAIGSAQFMADSGISTADWTARDLEWCRQGKTVLYVARDNDIAALIAVSDPVKPDSPAAISALIDAGLHVVMISGDKSETAHAIARSVGIDHVIAEVLPEGKVDAVKQLRAKYGTVAFVGDGINDAPALAIADVGVAIGTGTDIAIEAADVVLMSGALGGIVNAIDLSHKTLRNIRQNLFWAFAYNASLIPVAMGILYPIWGIMLSPMLAAGAMALSSVFVVSNALRMRRALPVFSTYGAPTG